MNGVPIPVMRAGRKETAYLSTRRSGEVGEKMTAAKAEHRRARNNVFKIAARVRSETMALPPNPNEAQMDAALGRQEELLDLMSAATAEVKKLAVEIVGMSLAENHGPDAVAILDCMTDKQVNDCVAIIETGDVPADFFPLSGTQQKQSSISGPGVVVSGDSPSTGSAEPTSRAAQSESKTP
jgi:hypothetical protein